MSALAVPKTDQKFASCLSAALRSDLVTRSYEKSEKRYPFGICVFKKRVKRLRAMKQPFLMLVAANSLSMISQNASSLAVFGNENIYWRGFWGLRLAWQQER